MREKFFAFYRPSDSEFEDLWARCLFSFDANVLLDLYRFSPQSQTELFDVLRNLKERVWLTHQAAAEYHEHRWSVISMAYDPVFEAEKKVAEITKSISEVARQHPFVTEEVRKSFCEALQAASAILTDAANKHPDLLSSDSVGEQIADLFTGKVGPPYDAARLQQLYKEGDERYSQRVPPGYADMKRKDGVRVYGDFVLWRQLMDKAVEAKRPVILITRDMKEDWWYEVKGKTILPRPQLRAEFFEKTGQHFYIYTTTQFVKFAKDFLRVTISDTLISEANELSDEQKARSAKETEVEAQKGYALALSPEQFERIRQRWAEAFSGLEYPLASAKLAGVAEAKGTEVEAPKGYLALSPEQFERMRQRWAEAFSGLEYPLASAKLARIVEEPKPPLPEKQEPEKQEEVRTEGAKITKDADKAPEEK